MPGKVSFVIIGQDHADASVPDNIHPVMMEMHKKGVPLKLMVENSHDTNLDGMIAFNAQHVLEARLLKEGANAKTGEQRLREGAATMGVKLEEPLKPYLIRDLKVTNLALNPDKPDFTHRAPAYERELAMFLDAKKAGITLGGLEHNEAEMERIDKAGLGTLDKMEYARIKGMSERALSEMEVMAVQGNGGVALAVNVGNEHVASLKTMLEEDIKKSVILRTEVTEVTAIPTFSGAVQPGDVVNSMCNSAENIDKHAALSSGVGLGSKKEIETFAERVNASAIKMEGQVVAPKDLGKAVMTACNSHLIKAPAQQTAAAVHSGAAVASMAVHADAAHSKQAEENLPLKNKAPATTPPESQSAGNPAPPKVRDHFKPQQPKPVGANSVSVKTTL